MQTFLVQETLFWNCELIESGNMHVFQLLNNTSKDSLPGELQKYIAMKKLT